ncbi:hypothetical protein GH714_028273 [Hevea brasiliensis]|uniref:RING-type E3 ubiquitin transferase n=1 Tax=Hevea brasiliensis TaxID=3981 RepID=A0A6A6MI05_HEVBR|nr:hypothetical protein GH714_028273 [Hevea brasiliensis]
MFGNVSFFCLFMLVLVNRGGGLNECKESRCGIHGPVIRFPFRLKDKQPDYCGYPGFDLSCKKHHTLLERPTSVKLYVDGIDYASQLIFTSDPDNCLPRQLLNFNLSAFPFQFRDESRYDYVLFNCSSIDRNLQLQMPCLSGPGYDIFAFTSGYPISLVSPAYRTKMFNISSVPGKMISAGNFLHLNWSQPTCIKTKLLATGDLSLQLAL